MNQNMLEHKYFFELKNGFARTKINYNLRLERFNGRLDELVLP